MPKDSPFPSAPLAAAPATGAARLFPYFVLRVAGEPSARWQHLHDGAVAAALARMQDGRTRQQRLTAPVCDALQRAVAAAEHDREARRALLQARRAAFNGRPPRLSAAHAAAWLAPSAQAALAELQTVTAQLAADQAAFASLFEAEASRSLQRLRRAARAAPALLAGIHYTSPALYELLTRWLRDGGDVAGKSARRLQATLLDFALRAAFKTSPLASFTPVVMGAWLPTGAAGTDLGERQQRSTLRFNHSYLLHALEPLWRDPARLGPAFPLQLNPTLRQQDGRLHWQQLSLSLPRHGKFWGNEHPQRSVALNPTLSTFLQAIGALAEPLNLATITQALAAALPGQPVASVEYFVHTLLALNVLHPRWERCQQTDLLAAARALADRLAPQAARPLAATLDQLAALAAPYPAAPLAERVPLRQALEDAAAPLATSASMPLFFEDCHLDGPRVTAASDAWQAILDRLHEWLPLQALFDDGAALQSWVAQHFIAAFGADGVCCDVEGFLRSLPPPEQTDSQALWQTASGARLHALRTALCEHLLDAAPGRSQTPLDPAFCQALARRLPAAIQQRPLAHCFFGQRSGEHFVLNRSHAGGAALMSRFMHQLSDAELDVARAAIARQTPGALPLELPGVFGFNGNLRPPLCAAELQLDGALPGHAGAAALPLSTLRLRYCARTDRLELLTAGGQPCAVYYLGFLLARHLPPAYQLLARNICAIPELWLQLYRHRPAPTGQLWRLPRITLGPLVLARRSWVFPPAVLPDPKAPAPDFALAMHALRCRHGLPAQVFVRSFAGEAGEPGKPAYIHLDSPLHLRQLAAAMRQPAALICLQEALPEPGDGGVTLNGRQHAAEMQIELSWTPAAGAQP